MFVRIPSALSTVYVVDVAKRLVYLQAQFVKASQLTGEEFMGKLNYYADAWLPARDLLIASINASKQQLDASGKIILFEQFLPWKVGFQSHLPPPTSLNPPFR